MEEAVLPDIVRRYFAGLRTEVAEYRTAMREHRYTRALAIARQIGSIAQSACDTAEWREYREMGGK